MSDAVANTSQGEAENVNRTSQMKPPGAHSVSNTSAGPRLWTQSSVAAGRASAVNRSRSPNRSNPESSTPRATTGTQPGNLVPNIRLNLESTELLVPIQVLALSLPEHLQRLGVTPAWHTVSKWSWPVPYVRRWSELRRRACLQVLRGRAAALIDA